MLLYVAKYLKQKQLFFLYIPFLYSVFNFPTSYKMKERPQGRILNENMMLRKTSRFVQELKSAVSIFA